MKYAIVLAAVLAVAYSQEIIDQLTASIDKLNLPAEKQAKFKDIVTTTGRDCLTKAAEGVPSAQIQSTMAILVPAMVTCGGKVKDIPADQAEQKKTQFKACMVEQLSKSSLDESQKAFMKQMKLCLIAAKAAKAAQAA